MPREFKLRKEVLLDASPEQVWQAIATGPGLATWLWSQEVEPGEGGRVRISVGDHTEESAVTRWDPPRRFSYQGGEGADGSVHAFEYLIEARGGGSTVLRFVHSGFLGDDWAAEFEGQTGMGWDMYFHTLAQYFTYFPGRAATYVSADGPQASAQADAWPVLLGGLGLTGRPEEDDMVRLTPDGLAPIEGTVDYVLPAFLGVRTTDGLYRFHGRAAQGLPVAVGHHIYSGGVDQKQTESSWRSWLSQIFAA
jgi:uncharacterized protein YndB with AHSA1/START domain